MSDDYEYIESEQRATNFLNRFAYDWARDGVNVECLSDNRVLLGSGRGISLSNHGGGFMANIFCGEFNGNTVPSSICISGTDGQITVTEFPEYGRVEGFYITVVPGSIRFVVDPQNADNPNTREELTPEDVMKLPENRAYVAKGVFWTEPS